MRIGVVSNQNYNNNCNKPCPKPAFGSVIPVVVKLDGKVLPHSKETSNLITRFVRLLNAKKLGENTDKIIKAFRQVDKDFFGELASIRGVKSDVLKSSNGDFWARLENKNCWVNPNNQYWKNNSFLSNFKTKRQWVSPRGTIWEHIKPNVWARHLITNSNDIENIRALGKLKSQSDGDAAKYEKGITNLIKSAKRRIKGIRCFVIDVKTTGVTKHKNGTETPKTKIINAYFVPPIETPPPAPPKPQKQIQLEFNF